MSLFTYSAMCLDVLDGDSIRVQIDLGFSTHVITTLRLSGINCPEKNTIQGKLAAEFTADWIAEHGGKIFVRTIKDKREKFGRLLGVVTDSLGDLPACLNDDLLNAGLAVVYTGGPR